MFARALLVESYAISPGVVGVLLGAVALAALPGKMLARPWLAGHARELLVVLGIAAALLTALFGIVRPGAAASTAILVWMQSSALAPTTRPLRTTSGSPTRPEPLHPVHRHDVRAIGGSSRGVAVAMRQKQQSRPPEAGPLRARLLLPGESSSGQCGDPDLVLDEAVLLVQRAQCSCTRRSSSTARKR